MKDLKNDQMLAAVYHGPLDIRVEYTSIPEIGNREALLRVISTGICGTDMRIYHGAHRKYPPGTTRIPGHEVVGEIVQVGKNVSEVAIGEKIFFAPNTGCGHCQQCISGRNNLCADYDAPGITYDGSFAEYMRIPEKAILQGNIFPLGDRIDPAAAALTEPFACVLRGQDALHIQPGESVLIIGAGPIGIMHVLLARFRGAGKVMVSEINPGRLAQVADFDVDHAINPIQDDLPSIIAQETHRRGVDVVIVAAPSHKPQEQALELASIGGRINFFGGLPKDRPTISFDSNLVHYKELLVTGTTACSTEDCRRAVEIINTGRIDLSKLIGARYPLKEAVAAFHLMDKGEALKVILEP